MNIFDLPIQDLIYFVKEGCHKTLDELLNELNNLIDENQLTLDKHSPDAHEFSLLLKDFLKDVHEHLAKEEHTLFPLIEAGNMTLAHGTIDSIVLEHTDLKIKLKNIMDFTLAHDLVDENDIKTLRILSKLHE